MGLKRIKFHILVCKNDSCVERGGKEVAKALKRALDDAGLRKQVLLSKVRCLKQCGRGPVVVVYPDGCGTAASPHATLQRSSNAT